MKKMILLIFLILIFFTLQAPVVRYDDKIIEQWKRAEQIWYWQSIIEAVVWVESSGDAFAFNKKEGAVGAFQIRQCRVDHYNKLKGTKYKLKDFFDYNLSKEMFLYFAKGKDFETACKNWNGSGPLTEIYWQKIKHYEHK
jgi:hypothetical protein